MADSSRIRNCFSCFLLVLTLSGTTALMHTHSNVHATICGLTSGFYHIDTLIQPRSWQLNYTKNPGVSCISDDASGQKGCNFTLAFCGAVNCSDTNTKLMNASACIATTGSDKQSVYKLGSYNPNSNPFMEDPKGMGLRFLVHYTNGSSYNTSDNKPCNLSMEVQFSCNEKSLWTADPSGKPSNISTSVLNNLTYDGKTCKYTLAFNYSGACPTVTPFPVGPLTNPLSFGSVLLIVFAIVFSVYCVFGSMCKFAAGSRGKDALPHSDFWVELPAYIADGFIFTCSCCKTSSSSSRTYESI